MLFVGLSIHSPQGSAMDLPATWSPLGWIDELELTNGASRPASGSTFASSKAGVCAKEWAYVGSGSRRVLLTGNTFCPAVPDDPTGMFGDRCTWTSNCATAAFAGEDDTQAIQPVCHELVLTGIAPPDRVASMSHNVEGTQCFCADSYGKILADAIPDLKSGYCVSPRLISLGASRTRYLRKEANKPISLDSFVRRSLGSGMPLSDEPVRLEVQSSTGTPGTVTPSAGPTDATATFHSEYRFPSFAASQIDTVTATCQSCAAPATVQIKMAPVVIGFFNGVWNTREQAGNGLTAIKELMKPAAGDIPLRYENFYNQTGKGNGNTDLQDIAEVFIQRGNELDGVLANRWEHYWDLLSGRHGDPNSLTGSLLNGLKQGGSALADLIDAAANAMLAGFANGLSRLLSNPPTAADMGAQLSKLQSLADEGSDFVLVAHSQGNLFVNTAYDGLRASRPDTQAKVVHVAPASPTTRGDHVLADIDQVINGLRNFGTTSVPDINIWLPWSKADASGHMLVGTYLDPSRAARERVRSMIAAALDAL